MKRKLLLITLCTIMLLSTVLVSCKKDPPPITEESGPVTDAEASYWDTLPENDTKCSELHAIAFTTNKIPKELAAEASAVDTALFNRDMAVQEKLDINIDYTEVTTQTAVSTMRNSALNDVGHQVFFYQAQQLMQLSTEGLLQDLHSVPVLDLSQAWWNQSLNQNMTINGKSFVAAGEWSQWYFGAPIAMGYNKNLAASYGITNIDKLVDDGAWTYEALYQLACEERQLNNDTDKNGVMNEKDFYAISVYSPALFGLFVSAGGQFSTIDQDGVIHVDIGNEASISRLDTIIGAFSSETVFYTDDITTAETLFLNNQSVFFFAPLGFFGDFLDASFSYGIIPTPKLNTTQKNYIACANPQSNFCVSIPRGLTEEEQKLAGLFLEGYGYMSHKLVKPAKYDEFMQLRVATDPVSSRRLDQMFESLYFDINMVMNFGNSRELLNKAIFNESTGRYKTQIDGAVNAIKTDIDKLILVTTTP